jgi:hypothetical protein
VPILRLAGVTLSALIHPRFSFHRIPLSRLIAALAGRILRTLAGLSPHLRAAAIRTGTSLPRSTFHPAADFLTPGSLSRRSPLLVKVTPPRVRLLAAVAILDHAAVTRHPPAAGIPTATSLSQSRYRLTPLYRQKLLPEAQA